MKANIKTTQNRRYKSNAGAILFLAVLFSCYHTSAQTAKNFTISQPFSFEENKGQLRDESGNALSDIKYYGKQGGVYVYCKSGMISFVFTKAEQKSNDVSEATGMPVSGVGVQNPEPQHLNHPFDRSSLSALRSSISASRMDLVLINSNLNPEITASDQQEYFENFYTTADADHGITNVHTYKTVTYKDIYPHIDLILNIAKKGMEYSFLVHPGGNVNDIKLRWNGAEKSKVLKNGGVKYANMLGSMEESAPKSFVDGKMLQSGYTSNRGNYGFNVGKYDKNKDLLIDPTLIWATYYGGAGYDKGSSVSTDKSRNSYIVGVTSSAKGIATSGAYQTSITDSTGAFLAKFSSSCSLLWATYYGGSGGALNGVSTDASGNVFITGNTSSTIGIATSGAHQTSNNGGGDAMLAKFSSSGSIIWATYYGGSGSDVSNGVNVDASGNVYITGSTTSNDHIASSGAFHTSDAGSGDAYLAKFSSSGGLAWATYFGGVNDEKGTGVSTDKSGNIFITGYTKSTSGITTSGAYQTSYQASLYYDAFLAKFNPSGNLSWATYYGGSQFTLPNSVTTDTSGNVFITGSSGDSLITSSGAHQSSYQGASDVFLAKFSNSGSFAWGTYYGGAGLDDSHGAITDISGNVYITGYTFSSTGIATSGAYQSSIVNGEGAFLAKFSASGNLDWGTYFGHGADWGNGIAIGPLNNVFIIGNSDARSPIDTGISTSGEYQTAGAGGTEAFLANFFFENYQYDAGISSVNYPLSTFCIGKQSVEVQLKNFGTKELDSVEIGWAVDKIPQTPFKWAGKLIPGSSIRTTIGSYTFATAGSYSITAWTSKPNSFIDSFPQNDTATQTVKFISFDPSNITYSALVGKCGYVTFQANDTIDSFSKDFLFTADGTHGNAPLNIHNYGSYQYNRGGFYRYTLILNSVNGCSALIHDSLTIAPYVYITLPNDTIVCKNASVTITPIISDATKPYTTYGWDSFGTTITKHLKITKDTFIHIEVRDSTGCSNHDSIIIKADSNCVWPGDANYDKVDNMNDILAIGIAYNFLGNKRMDTTTQWYAHPCIDWAKTFKSGANYKHADCNGDGKVDSTDMAAIMRNYSKTHSKSGGSNTSGNPNDPPLYLSISKDSVGTSDTISILMNLGTATKSLSNLYGLCYSITYDPVNVGHAKSISIDLANCWMGTLDKNLVYLIHNDSINGVMDIGITRTDHKNVSGYGTIGKLTIITPDNVGGKKLLHKELQFGIENVKAIDNVEDDISLYTSGDSVLFYGYSGILEPINSTKNNIHLYPNPAHSSLQIDAGKDFISEIEVSDILGRNVLSLKYIHNQKAPLNINSLSPGTYYIYILTDHGFARSRFVKD